MRRFFVSADRLEGEEVLLTGEVLRHLGRVLRLSVGDEILLLDGSGLVCRCRLAELGKSSGRARVLERWREEESVLPIRLLQGVPKGDRMDIVLQKGTELGVAAFSPVISARSVSRPDQNRSDRRRDRWQRIVTEAARQSGRCRLPEVDPPRPLDEALAGCTEELRLLLWEEGELSLESVLAGRRPRDAAILIGPEGGFSGDEAQIARRAEFIPVGLGPRILRTETAGFALCAILQYLFGDLAEIPKTPGRQRPSGG